MKEKADIFKALGDETRLTIIDMLSFGEICACKITEGLHLSQPTISHHMKILQHRITTCKSKPQNFSIWIQFF